jgi:hypothetical protein
MDKCIRDYTVINSQPSIEALEKLVAEIFWAYGLCSSAEDIFYYGVFCKPQNYMNFEFDGDYDFEVPSELTSPCNSDADKMNFVKKTIKQIMRHEIEKPEWMKYVELNMDCNEYGMPPSTFLQVEAKDPRFENVAQKLIEFLYSPNLLMTMVKST